ncbi:hypothetical protein SAMN05877753_101322 [Bacillus oleivorans]|uniref:Tetratricopeptide repeat protein n=1 Tax=Bacillus oleivorans TaxID=1448271 RepID=A0A285CJ24_9BACI|nr:hypothetical protein [Bacillus oleivorans]SNX67008.1 hypothetical protein SAMN05877753_101322 [Bacillus oleivorans]
MNKVEDLLEVNNLLNDFIEAIHFYDKDEATALYEKVRLIEREGLDKEVIDRLDLFLFRYFVFVHDYEKSEEIEKELQSRFESFSTENQIIFNTYYSVAKIVNININPALEMFHSILDDNPDLPDFLLSDIYYHLCWGYVYLDDYKRSVVYGNKALDLYLSEFNYFRIIYTQMLLAISHFNLGFYDEAEEIYKHLIRNSKLVNLHHLVPHIEYNHCVSLTKSGNYVKAIENTRSLLNILNKDEEIYIQTLLSLLEAKIMQRDLSEVEDLIELAKERSSKNKSFEKYTLLTIYYEKKLSSEYDAYRYLTNTLAPYLLENSEKKVLSDLTKMMGDYFIKQRNYELASNYYELNLSLN